MPPILPLCPICSARTAVALFDGISRHHCTACAWMSRDPFAGPASLPPVVEPQRGSVIPAQGCAPRALRATLGSVHVESANPERVASFRPFVPVVQSVENEYGWMGPDFALITLRNGKLLEIGDDGINVYPDANDLGGTPEASISFV